MKIDPRLLK